MIITTDNYEEYFYRYCEGELTAEERAAVEVFAAQHPKLAEELSLYDPTLKLEESPMPYPDKESILHHEAKVMSLFRHTPALRATPLKRGWAIAACVSAVLIGGVWMMWPNGEPTEQTGMVAQMLQPAHEVETVLPASQPKEELPIVSTTPTEQATSSAEPAAPKQEEPAESMLQYEPLTLNEPNLLADADTEPLSNQEDTTVIEYIDITIFPIYQSEVEVVAVAYQPTVGERFRAFRSRVSNTVRDYAYQSYAEARGELRTRINY